MNTRIKITGNVFFLALLFFMLPGFALAQNPGLENYITIGDIVDFLKWLYSFFIKVIFPIVILVTIYTGYRFLTAQGSEEKIQKAKQSFIWLVIGLVIVLAGWLIVTVISNTVGELAA